MIVIVDDDPTSLRLLSMVLRREGLKAATFADPVAALEFVKGNAGIQLIISDIRMPGMSGLELAAAARATEQTRYTPVVLCTSLADVETVRDAASKGIRDYIVKPIEPAVVARKIRAILDDVGSIMSTPSEMKARLGIEAREYVELARETIPNLEQLIAGADAAIAASDAAALAVIAERVGEPARIFAANRCVAAAERLVTLFDDESAIVEAGRQLVRETLLFRAMLQRASVSRVGSTNGG